jgi:hypothetical protein
MKNQAKDGSPPAPVVNTTVRRWGGTTVDQVGIDTNRRSRSSRWRQWVHELVALPPGLLLIPDLVLWVSVYGLWGHSWRLGLPAVAWLPSVALGALLTGLVVSEGAGKNNVLAVYRLALCQLGLWVY